MPSFRSQVVWMPVKPSDAPQPRPEGLVAELDEELAPLGVETPGPPDILGEMAALDELGESALQDQWRELAGDGARPLEARSQRLRQHHEAQPQGREQRLREGAHVDGAPGVVDALHRRYRLAAEAILAVEVVLDDPGIVAMGDLEQAAAAGRAAS